MSQATEVHTGITNDVRTLDEKVVALLDEGKKEEARTLYERSKNLIDGIGARLRTASAPSHATSAPSVIIKPGETERRIITPKEARDLMQGRVFGVDKMEKAFGWVPNEVPPIVGSTLEFKNAAALGQSLRLRGPLSMREGHEKIAAVNRGKSEGKRRKALYSIDELDCWYKNEDFATNEKPQTHWALTSGESLAGSYGINFLEQTGVLKEELEKVFHGLEMPREYAQAIEEYEAKRKDIELIINNWAKASEMLADLMITKLLRPTPAEQLEDINVDQESGGQLLRNNYTWTSARGSLGRLVLVGYAGPDGARVRGWSPGNRYGVLGASFSRRLPVSL